MILRIDKSVEGRPIELFTGQENHRFYPYELRKRLTGKNGYDFINLCHLYITFDYIGFGMSKEEKIEIMDVRPDDILQKVDEMYENDDLDYDLGIFEYFIGGVAKDIGDKKVEITFGVFPDELRQKYEAENEAR